MEPRAEVIERLCDAAAEAILELNDELQPTPAEIISTYFTLTGRACRALIRSTKGAIQATNRSTVIDTLTALVAEFTGTVH